MLGINHPSPLIYCGHYCWTSLNAGNQSSILFDILYATLKDYRFSWESIIHPL